MAPIPSSRFAGVRPSRGRMDHPLMTLPTGANSVPRGSLGAILRWVSSQGRASASSARLTASAHRAVGTSRMDAAAWPEVGSMSQWI